MLFLQQFTVSEVCTDDVLPAALYPDAIMCVCVMQAGGLDRLTLDSLYDKAVTTANENRSHQMEPVASNPLENAQSN